MPTGTVRWFDAIKGYGFILPEDGSRDVFVHISELHRSSIRNLAPEQGIVYEMDETRTEKGPCAINLALVGPVIPAPCPNKKRPGVVRWFNHKKGYGFIQPDDGTDDVFFHKSALKKLNVETLCEGEKILFKTIREDGKAWAENLQFVHLG